LHEDYPCKSVSHLKAMQIKLTYGRHGLTVTLPDTVDVLAPRFIPGLPDEPEALQRAMRHPIGSAPLAELVKPGDSVVIVHTDITRATPNDRILPVLLDELESRI
jgi:nickel-dependent lactate racemase